MPVNGPSRVVVDAGSRAPRATCSRRSPRIISIRGAGADYAVTVVAREDSGAPVFSLPEGAAVSEAAADLTAGLFDVRLDQLGRFAAAGKGMSLVARDRLAITIVRRTERRRAHWRATTGGDGQGARWRLLVRHRAGSLEAAVAQARQRNLALSFGILVMMALSVALIVVAARRAQRLARQQIEFVAGVSHELRTPVAVIGAAADNLSQGVVSDPARVKQYGAAIQGEARRLGETVERVLQFAGIQAGHGIGHRVPVALVPLLEETLSASGGILQEAGAEVETGWPRRPAAGARAIPPRSGPRCRTWWPTRSSTAVPHGGCASARRRCRAGAGARSRSPSRTADSGSPRRTYRTCSSRSIAAPTPSSSRSTATASASAS